MAGTGDDKPATFSPTGAFALTDGVVRTDDTGCKGTRGHDDIAEGTFVAVYDAAGVVATTGNLGSSKYAERYCIFKVAVDDVPKGEKFYQGEVPHRGKVQLGGMEPKTAGSPPRSPRSDRTTGSRTSWSRAQLGPPLSAALPLTRG
ncbi:hypothetical protein [Streptomyces sp. NPDC002205]|uniref:hypothetical protein n=1 Tax=Streptomyces sp. NPDC002205 TaxID=3154411 RepID=UPI0033340628